jgi:hypothetical protein
MSILISFFINFSVMCYFCLFLPLGGQFYFISFHSFWIVIQDYHIVQSCVFYIVVIVESSILILAIDNHPLMYI